MGQTHEPYVQIEEFSVLEHGPRPEPVPVRLSDTNATSNHLMAIRTEGVVIDAFPDEIDRRYMILLLKDRDVVVPVSFLRDVFGDRSDLVDATIRVTGVYRRAVGVLLKDTVDMDLVSAIRLVISGNQVIPTHLLKQIEQDNALNQLSARKLEILSAVAEGRSNSDIARQFGLSEITVKKHLSAIFESLGVSNRAEAVALALRKQMLKS